MLRADSPLQRVPAAVEIRQRRLLTGIRVCIQQIDLSYQRLLFDLTALSRHGDQSEHKVAAMLDAWAVVDGVALLLKLSTEVLGRRAESLRHLEAVRLLRNDRQHLEERLVRASLTEEPDWGALGWIWCTEPQRGESKLLVLGHARTGLAPEMINPALVASGPGVTNVRLASFAGNVDLSEAYEAVARFVSNLESQLEPQFEGLPTTHADLVISLHFERVGGTE